MTVIDMKMENNAVKIQLPVAVGKDSAVLYGYKITKDGKIVNMRSGKALINKSYVNLYIGKQRIKINVDKVIYQIFSGEKLDDNIRIMHIDDNEDNHGFENLLPVNTKNIYVGRKVFPKKISREIAEQIIRERTEKHATYKKLAEQFGCSIYTIHQIVKGEYYA